MNILDTIRKNQKMSLLIAIVITLVILFLVANTIASKAADNAAQELKVANTKATAERSTLYYYEIENEDRYAAYSAANPDVAWDDVVWHVNVQLDREPYEDPIIIENVDAWPILVNKHYMYPADFVPKDIVDTRNGKPIRKEVYDAYNLMRDDIRKEKLELAITSGYRSIAEQEDLYNYYLSKAGGKKEVVDADSSRAGFSEHHSGNTIDLIAPNFDMEDFGKSKESEWVIENAHKYGFIIRYTEENTKITGYQPEAWHITYVGAEIATFMKENNILSFEEYYAKYILHHPSEAEQEDGAEQEG